MSKASILLRLANVLRCYRRIQRVVDRIEKTTYSDQPSITIESAASPIIGLSTLNEPTAEAQKISSKHNMLRDSKSGHLHHYLRGLRHSDRPPRLLRTTETNPCPI